ncbi:MAG: RIP metalloprotease RseP [Candidatus Magasanikbacteria bacterium]|nr:RIP metalloprotease RseP [Candidatus Magasanikbacteria bacterium]
MFITIIAFIGVLSLIVFFHELGHFWTARKFGVKSEEFGLGFPPRAIGIYRDQENKWKKVFGGAEVKDASDTIYSLNWIPLGGFVKIKGENGENEGEQDSFASQKIWKRAIILLAGVSMNLITAVILTSIGFMIGLPQVLGDENSKAKISNQQVQIVEVMKDSPASRADLKTGDIILSINEQPVTKSEELQDLVDVNKNQVANYKIKRSGDVLDKQIIAEVRAETGRGGIGVGISSTGLVRYPVYLALWHGLTSVVALTGAILMAFWGLLSGLFTGQGMSAEVAGPIGIATLTGQVAHMGFIYLLQFTVMLSVNLAIINAFPFPALDGGRLFFLAIEKIKGSPVKQEFEAIVHNLGFAFLMILMVAVTFKDVSRYGGVFKALWGRIIDII